jgi:hypothetical protein
MSLEFAVHHPCSLRARYEEKHLREWGRLSNLHTILTTVDQHAPSPDKLHWIEQAGAQIDLMEQETAICADCPARLPSEAAGEGEAVGCLGRINYPIDGQFEKFIADRVQLVLDTVDREDQPRLLHILVDPESPFDGEATKNLRRVTTAESLRFFELVLPIRLSRAASQLTTDNIFDMLAGFRSENAEVTGYAREFPLAATADYYDFLDLLLRNDLSELERTRLHARSRTYGQFLRLLSALERAEALETRVLID